jgi:hypothetical protein
MTSLATHVTQAFAVGRGHDELCAAGQLHAYARRGHDPHRPKAQGRRGLRWSWLLLFGEAFSPTIERRRRNAFLPAEGNDG